MRSLITKAYIQLNLISYCNVQVVYINNRYFTLYVNYPIKNSFNFFRGLSVVYKADGPCTRANRPWNTDELLAVSMAHLLVVH